MNDIKLGNLGEEQLKAIRNDIYNLEKSINSEKKLMLNATAGLTMLPPSRLIDAYTSAMQAALRYPKAAIVEFDVYKGGALGALSYGYETTENFTGKIIGFDTFEGHVRAPLINEIDIHGNEQRPIYEQKRDKNEDWAACSLKDVETNIKNIFGQLNIHQTLPLLVKGDACSTTSDLPNLCKEGISLLRLDMDWYESTKAALESALPLLQKNWIIIIDDYGHHSGVKEATDEILANLSGNRYIDETMTDYSCKRIVFI